MINICFKSMRLVHILLIQYFEWAEANNVEYLTRPIEHISSRLSQAVYHNVCKAVRPEIKIILNVISNKN